MRPPPRDLQTEFAVFAGEMAESLSFNRSIGQIYGLLYIHPAPLSLDEISRRLGMSKGNASINVRTLESWGAVRPVSVQGSRRDHYEADRRLRELLVRRAREGLTKRLDLAEERVKRMATSTGGEDGSAARVKELLAFLAKGRRAVRTLSKLSGLF